MSDYWTWTTLPGGALTKPGIPGYPALEPSQALLVAALDDLDLSGVGRALDLSARGGALLLALRDRGLAVAGTDSSAASRSALTRFEISDAGVNDDGFSNDGFSNDDAPSDLVCQILSGERGNARVFAELHQVWTRTAPGGRVLVAGDKDKGFERYLKTAAAWFGESETIRRGRGFRVAQLRKTQTESPPSSDPLRFSIQARGHTLNCVAHPGTFAGGKLDAASALLLEHLPAVTAGKRVLDIGAGYGALGGLLALEGAEVTLLEDDAFSVRSVRDTLALNTLSSRVLHSDVDSALAAEARFELVVMNPPFHVGRDLKLDVALEFIRAAARHLLPGGEAWLVANHFLPYETPLRQIGSVEEIASKNGFKLLRARKT